MRPPLPHFSSIPNSSEAVRATSNPQASSDGRTSSGWRQGPAVAALPFGVAEAGDVVGGGQFRREIRGGVSKRMIHTAKL